MTQFAPYPVYWDEAPVDISFVFSQEKPAGIHGFLKVKGNAFAFEDGTPGLFWGTNFNSGTNFPDFDYSEKTARRLARIGVNVVRFHQLDSEWATPNIFQFSKGERTRTTRRLDPESMKRLDYLIYCLKQEGIYCYLDLMTYRKFKSGDGVPNAIRLGDSAKPYSVFSRRLIDLQKEFANNIWNHINPYTGMAYKDDPVFILTEITNECDMFNSRFSFDVEPYHSELVRQMKDWLAEQNLAYPADTATFKEEDEVMIRFKMAVQERYYRELYDFMREIDVKIPITGTNWSINAANVKTQKTTDFDDNHAYFYGWNWGEFKKGNDPRAMVAEKDGILPGLAFSASPDRPFFVSEWDTPWPNEYRADSSLQLAAAGSLQGWAGFAIHTYMYATRRDQKILGKEINSRSISNVPYREGIFSTWNDPAKFGVFYHAALIMRRGDVKTAEKTLAVAIKDLTSTSDSTAAMSLVAEQHKVGLTFDGQPHGADAVVEPDQAVVDTSSGEVTSDTGELWRSWAKRIGKIDTPRTQCIYGFLAENGLLSTRDMSVAASNDYATIALSSLTDDAINVSDNLLLTTIGRAENTGMTFSEDKTEVLDIGREPILIEVIEADVVIRTSRENLTVWSIGPEGFYAGRIPSTCENGELRFHLGDTCQSMYYLILEE